MDSACVNIENPRARASYPPSTDSWTEKMISVMRVVYTGLNSRESRYRFNRLKIGSGMRRITAMINRQ